MTDRTTLQRTTLTATRYVAWIAVALLVFVAVAGAAARPVRAASVTPIAHEGNVTEKDNGCPAGDIAIDIDVSATSGSAGGVTITVTYHNDKTSLDFSASGGVVDIAYVKGGPNYNEYDYSPAVASDTDLVAPLNGGNQLPTISHSVYCVQKNQTTTSSTSSSTSSTTSQTSSTTQSSSTTETSATSESSTTETSATSESSTTETTATTETSGVSETTDTTQTSTSQGNTETGGVGGETGTPEVTPPSTSSIGGSSGSSDGWRVILLVLAGIAVLSLILLPSEGKTSKR